MRLFVQLYRDLNQTNKTQAKVDALARYFEAADPLDAAWSVYFLSGRKLKSIVRPKQLKAWMAELSGIPLWLVERSYEVAGDLAETLALIYQGPISSGDPPQKDRPLSEIVLQVLMPMAERGDASKFEMLSDFWRSADADERFLFNKLLTGGMRLGVSRTLVERGIAQAFQLPVERVTQQLMGDWEPSVSVWESLRSIDVNDNDPTRPYPFCLASPVESKFTLSFEGADSSIADKLAVLGSPKAWQFEWKWDGIRAQIIRRGDTVMLWSRGEERLHETFPELCSAAKHLPNGTVIDGEIVAWKRKNVSDFSMLQHRLGRKRVSRQLLDKYRCSFIAYDLLESEGLDIREKSLRERRGFLEDVVKELLQRADLGADGDFGSNNDLCRQAHFLDMFNEDGNSSREPLIQVSELLEVESWEYAVALREESRPRGVEGFMLKRKDSSYKSGRVKGDWWKWKLDPFTVDCVMLYAQAGHGRKAGLFTDYTFGLRDGERLMPFAKAYSGLTNAEVRKVDAWIKRNTLSRKGPIRTVKPELVFELAFDNLHLSKRHKAGIALRFPRIARWRQDKSVEEVDTKASLLALVAQ